MAKAKKATRPRVANFELQGELESAIRTFFDDRSADAVPSDHEITLLEEDLMEICTIQLRRAVS